MTFVVFLALLSAVGMWAILGLYDKDKDDHEKPTTSNQGMTLPTRGSHETNPFRNPRSDKSVRR